MRWGVCYASQSCRDILTSASTVCLMPERKVERESLVCDPDDGGGVRGRGRGRGRAVRLHGIIAGLLDDVLYIHFPAFSYPSS